MSSEIIPGRLTLEERKALSSLTAKKRDRETVRADLLRQVKALDYTIISIQADYGAIYNKRAPIFTLPVEVTCLIFLYSLCSGMDDDADDEEGSEPDQKPLLMEIVVSHVCQKWRTIALELPQLWSSFGYDSEEVSRVHIDRLETYLQRSGSQPLELFFDIRDTDEEEEEECLALVEKSILHVERWRRVTILADSGVAITNFIPQLRDVSAPNLEYLALRPDLGFLKGFPEGSKLETRILKGGAPRLTSVWLDTYTPFCLLPPLSNIVTLRLEEGQNGTPDPPFLWSSFLEILALPSLMNLSLLGTVFEVEPPPRISPMSPITMGSLVNLRFADCPSISNILLYLRAPRLKSLIMQNANFPDPIQLLPKYTFPSLQELVLTECECSSAASSIEFLKLTETITHLTLTQDTLDTTLIPFINDNATANPIYWPKLKHVTFNVEGSPTDITPYLSFVKLWPKRQLTIRIFEELKDYWTSEEHDRFRTFKRTCNIRLIDKENPLEMEHWPPGEDSVGYIAPNSRDPFDLEPYFDTNSDSDSD